MQVKSRLKVIVYVRVSSKEQERDGFSIPAQKRLISAYAKKNNLNIIKVFEEAETAKQAGRKQFRKMIEFLEENPDCKNILVEKVDRIYRNFHDLVLLDIDNKNLKLHLVKENQILSKDSKSHEKLQHDIKLVLARNYVNNLSEEVRKGLSEKVRQGGWPGPAPLGYLNRLENRTIIEHPEEGALVKLAFELASTGLYSLSKLKKELYAKGLKSKRSKKELGKEAMSRVLKNPFYYGYFLWKGEFYKGKHAPLIDKALFDKVQNVMGYKNKPNLTKREFAYQGTLTCGHCGCAITAEQKIKKSGKTYIYYHCTNGKRICDNVTYLREEKIDSAFKEALLKIRLTEEVIKWTQGALIEASKDEAKYRQAQITTHTRRYKRLETMISKAYEDKLDGTIEQEFWETKNAVWKNEQHEIQIQLDALGSANTDFMLDGLKLMEIANSSYNLFDHMTKNEKREVAHLILSNPKVVNGSIQYDYKKPFEMFVNVVDLKKWRGRVDDFRTFCLQNAV